MIVVQLSDCRFGLSILNTYVFSVKLLDTLCSRRGCEVNGSLSWLKSLFMLFCYSGLVKNTVWDKRDETNERVWKYRSISVVMYQLHHLGVHALPACFYCLLLR